MKRATMLLAVMLLCGLTFAAEKNLQEIDQRIAPPSFRPLDEIWCSQPDLAIPDDDSGAAVDVLTITEAMPVFDPIVFVQIEHTWIGDLRAELSYGNCAIQLFHRIGLDGDTCCGCSGDDIDVAISDNFYTQSIEDSCTTGPSGGAAGEYSPGDPLGNGIWPTALSDCIGQDVVGDWTLTVTDGASGDTGILREWCLYSVIYGPDGGDPVPATGASGLIILVALGLIGGALFVLQRRRT